MAKIVCESKAIVPDKFSVEAIIKAPLEALRQVQAEVLADFEGTAANWDHKPVFNVKSNQKDQVSVTTSDENWIRVDQGTQSKGRVMARKGSSGKRAFRIVKRRPKSKPGVMRSSGGGPTGEVVYRASYQHRGITPRNFTQQIVDKFTQRYPTLTSQVISKGVETGISPTSKDVKVRA